MTRYKSFLIPSSLLVLLVAGCALFNERRLINDDFPGTFYQTYSSKVSSKSFPIFLTGVSAQKLYDQEQHKSEDIYNYFCQGKTQRRPLQIEYQYVLPKMPSGLALDAANLLQQTWLKSAKHFAIEFFKRASMPPGPGKEDVTSADDIFPQKDPRAGDSCLGYFHSVPIKTQEELLSYFKTTDTVANHFDFMDNPVIFSYLEQSKQTGQKNERLLVVGNAKPYFTTFCYLYHYENGYRHYYWEIEHGDSTVGFRNGFFKLNDPIKVIPFRSEDKTTQSPNVLFTSDSVETLPMRIAHLVEPTWLRTYFTMLIPKEAQSEIFLSNITDSDHRDYGYINGQLSPSAALNQSYEMWDNYFIAMNTVQESPTDDPQIFNYSVSLNLEPFCKYGRAKDDLLSK